MEDTAVTIFFPLERTLVRSDSNVSLSRYPVEEAEDDLQLAEGSLLAHMVTHQKYINECISGEKPDWDVVEIVDSRNTPPTPGLRMVRSPAASRICSTALNPILFRTDCVSDIMNVAEIADLLGVSQIDAEWNNTISNAVNSAENHRLVKHALDQFLRLPYDSKDFDVSRQLHFILFALSFSLGVETDIDTQLSFQVGGLLAHEKYAYHGLTDLCVRSGRLGPRILTTVAKTEKTWHTDHRWYQGTRAVQLLGALFTSCFPDKDAYKSQRLEPSFFSKPSPGLLVTQGKFKLYVLCPNPGQGDDSHNVKLTCMTYPPGNDHGYTSSEEFLVILAICVLQAKDHQENQTVVEPLDSPSVVNGLLVPEVSFHGIKIWYPQVKLVQEEEDDDNSMF